MDLPFSQRIVCSIEVLAGVWFTTGVVFTLYLESFEGLVVFIWSVPLFAVAWVVVGLPLVLLGGLILRIPVLLIGAIGFVAGAGITILPSAIAMALSPGGQDYLNDLRAFLDWSYLKGLPAFGAVSGAAGVLFYRWRLAQAAPRGERI
jgi:hypothetical protein